RPASRCSACPRTLALPERERRDLLELRAAQDAALASAAGLVAPSRAMSAACRRVSGRPAWVAAPVVRAPAPARPRPGGPLSNVTVCEARSGIDTLLDGAAMLLVPSQHPEPFGRVAFEAMAAGVPTLSSATGGLSEYVPAEQLVAERDDPDAWAAAVRELERGPAWEAARRAGRAAAARVLAADTPGRIER